MAKTLSPRLVSAADIARSRLDANPPDPGLPKMLAWYVEVQKASAELHRGEWVLSEPSA